jgi:hypothetical protein
MAWVFNYGTDTLDDTDRVLGTNSAGAVKNFAGTEFGKLNAEDQVLAGGARVTSKQLSFPASPDVPLVIDPGDRPLQYVNNLGPFTIQAPANDGSCMLMIINSQSPDVSGAVTFSGFTVGSSTGDSLTTTAGHRFTVSIWRINGVSGYRVMAHQ